MPPGRKQQVVELLKSLETKDPVPFAYVNPNKYIQHNLQVGPGPAGVAALIQNMPPDASVNTIRIFEDGDRFVEDIFSGEQFSSSHCNIIGQFTRGACKYWTKWSIIVEKVLVLGGPHAP